MALPKQTISLAQGAKPLHDFLGQYKAEYMRDSSTEKGHVYWSAPIQQWLLVLRKGNNAQVTFHPAHDCPCKML